VELGPFEKNTFFPPDPLLKAMAAANKAAIEVLMEHMNAIVGTSGKNVDKENMPPNGNNARNATTKHPQKKSKNCSNMVFH
jgi:hypothetical protein